MRQWGAPEPWFSPSASQRYCNTEPLVTGLQGKKGGYKAMDCLVTLYRLLGQRPPWIKLVHWDTVDDDYHCIQPWRPSLHLCIAHSSFWKAFCNLEHLALGAYIPSMSNSRPSEGMPCLFGPWLAFEIDMLAVYYQSTGNEYKIKTSLLSVNLLEHSACSISVSYSSYCY